MKQNLRIYTCCFLAFFLGTGIASWCDAKSTADRFTLPVIISPHNASPAITGPLTNRAGKPVMDGPTATFQEQLEKGLRLRRPQEKQFVARIAALVEQRVLPRSLVNTSFNWARKRHQKFPFPYFQRAIIIRSARMGVHLNGQGMLVY